MESETVDTRFADPANDGRRLSRFPKRIRRMADKVAAVAESCPDTSTHKGRSLMYNRLMLCSIFYMRFKGRCEPRHIAPVIGMEREAFRMVLERARKAWRKKKKDHPYYWFARYYEQARAEGITAQLDKYLRALEANPEDWRAQRERLQMMAPEEFDPIHKQRNEALRIKRQEAKAAEEAAKNAPRGDQNYNLYIENCTTEQLVDQLVQVRKRLPKNVLEQIEEGSRNAFGRPILPGSGGETEAGDTEG